MKNQSSQAIVTAVKGSVFAISESGVKRALQLGDVVGIGETIVTEGNGTASLQTAGGELMQIVADQVVKLTRDVIEEEIPETDTSSMESASLDAVMKAVEEGKDISEVLEATAAGGGVATSSYGNSFINLQGLVFSNDLGFSFGVGPAYIPPVTQFAWISQFGNSTPDATVALSPELLVTKTGAVFNGDDSSDSDNTIDTATDYIKYTILVNNIGNETLSNLTITDVKLITGGAYVIPETGPNPVVTFLVGTVGSDGVFLQTEIAPLTVDGTVDADGKVTLAPGFQLEPGQSLELVFDYDVTQADIDTSAADGTEEIVNALSGDSTDTAGNPLPHAYDSYTTTVALSP